MRILIIDDNKYDQIILKKRLESTKMDFEVQTALNHLQAEELLSKTHFDLIFLDLFLGDSLDFSTGIDFLKRHSKDRVVILTGVDATSVIFNFIRNGAFDFIFKSDLKSDHLKRLMVYADAEQRAG